MRASILKRLGSSLFGTILLSVQTASGHGPEAIPFSGIGIPYAWSVELSAGEESVLPVDHVGAWSWDEDTFPETARGWTHTSKFVKLEITEPLRFTVKVESAADVPWPSAEEPGRLAGTNLFPSLTLYKGWDTDAGVVVNGEGVTIDQDHTFNNRGNIEWAEDVVYLDHAENSSAHSLERTWVLPAGQYTLNFGGNSPALEAEGRQGYKTTFTTSAVTTGITNGALATIPFSAIGVPYGIGLVMEQNSFAESLPDHVGAWSWDEDTFPESARGWTHTSKFVKLKLLNPAKFTLTLSNLADVPWPSTAEPGRVAGTNLFPSFTLYRGWDLDAGLRVDAEGVRIDQDHTFNNRGNIEWAEDIQYIDHVENAAEHAISRSWVLPAGDYTINLGGNSPATSAEGRQGYKAIFKTEAASAPVGNASLTTIAFSEIGIPYGIGIAMDDEARVETLPDHVGAWSWDEDSFPETARGWTHTSKFVKLNLQQSASLTVTLSNLADVPWPSTAEPARLAGNNLFPSFTIYKGWDTDAGVQVDGEGQTIDQDHTFNNRGNIEWAEDVIYMDHLENSTEHSATKTWILPAGRYTINLGGNSPATTAEGRQGYKAVLTTTPVALVQAASADGKITFAWSESNSGYSLYSSDSVDGPWELVGGTTLTAHGRKEQSVSVSPGMKFFVLKK